MKLSAIKPNPNNPRVIRDARFYLLVKSLLCFPKMLAKRKIVLSSREEPFSLGGNMRYKAIQHISTLSDNDFWSLCSEYQISDEDKKIWENVRKTKEVSDDWIDWAEDFTEEEKQRFVIADNVGFGEWDWDALGNEWDVEQLTDWGMEVSCWDVGHNINESMTEEDLDMTEEFDPIGVSSGLTRVVFIFDGKDEAESYLKSLNLNVAVKKQGQAWQVNLSTQSI